MGLSAAAVCFAVGQQAGRSCTGQDANTAVQKCLELHACGIFKRQHFKRGLQCGLQPEQHPGCLIQLLYQLIDQQLYGLSLLQVLLPDPAQACHVIHQACSSSVQHLLQLAPAPAADSQSSNQLSTACVPGPVQLLQMLLQQALGTVDAVDAVQEWNEAAAGLQQYVADLLRHLQEAAAVHEVLTVCLCKAAAASAPLVGPDMAGRWICHLLHSLLKHQSTPHSPVQQQAEAVAARCWQSLALQHRSWYCIVSCILACLPNAQKLLQQLQGCIAQAAATAQSLDRMCGVLSALREHSSSCTEAVHQMLSATLAGALSQACQAGLLPPLLLLQRLLGGATDYSRVLSDAAAQALGPDSANGVAAWCCFLDTISLLLNFTLPAADQALLQAHMQLLQQLKPSAASAMQRRIASTLDTLQDAAHALKQQLQQQAGTDSTIPPLNASIRSNLEQFRQQGSVDGRRCFNDVQAGKWALQRGHLPKMCHAITLNAPSNAADARLRWEFLMALEDHKLCPAGQMQKLLQTCEACGFDLAEGAAAAAGTAAAAAVAHPVDTLQQLLDKLPRAVGAQGPQAIQGLLRRISEQLQQILQQQQQQQGTGSGPPAKRQRRETGSSTVASADALQQPAPAASAAACAAATYDQLVDMLLTAHDAAMQQQGGVDLEWRLAFVQVLQQAEALHGPLLQLLQASMAGMHGSYEPQQVAAQVAARGRLAALLAAMKPSQMLLLQPDAEPPLVQHDAAAALYSWSVPAAASPTPSEHALATALASPAAAVVGCSAATSCRQQLQGFEVAQQMMSRVCLETPSQACCAASFWAGYVCEVKHLGRWCAGPHGPFQRERLSSASTSTCGGNSNSSTAGLGLAAAGSRNSGIMLGYLPRQMPALLRALAQRLSEALREGGAQQEEAAVLQECLQVCNKTLEKSKPMKWLPQQFAEA